MFCLGEKFCVPIYISRPPSCPDWKFPHDNLSVITCVAIRPSGIPEVQIYRTICPAGSAASADSPVLPSSWLLFALIMAYIRIPLCKFELAQSQHLRQRVVLSLQTRTSLFRLSSGYARFPSDISSWFRHADMPPKRFHGKLSRGQTIK